MHVNCDIGERGAEHPVDAELMKRISLANIACGGHAGDAESVAAFKALAGKLGVSVSAHLSYPDREHFGRLSMDIAPADLLKSLDRQYALIDGVDAVKFHGALYNDSWKNRDLAGFLAKWLKENGVRTVVAPCRSCIADECREQGIDLAYEAFAERRYAYDPSTDRLSLVDRKFGYASIETLAEAVVQAQDIMEKQRVAAYAASADGGTDRREVEIRADTICIHSDSPLALALAAALAEL